jgi:hypothetical protein
MGIDAILKGLATAAINPLAFVAYICAITAWVILRWRVDRNKNLLDKLDGLPEKDRLPAIEREIGTIKLKEGLSPEQYLLSRVHLYYFLGFIVLCGVVVILFAISSYRTPNPVSPVPERNTVANLDEQVKPLRSFSGETKNKTNEAPKRNHLESQEMPKITKAQPPKPDIASVSPISPQAWQSIVISGTHFGTSPPFRDCTDFLVIRDLTANRAFPSTGPWGGCNNPILVTSWADNEIRIEGLPAYQHGQPAFTAGDTLKIEVRNPQETWNSSAWRSVTVTESTGPDSPAQTTPTSPSQKPEEGTHIASVTPISTKAWQRIVITGVHFGANTPINGCPDFIRITDLTANRFFPSLGPWGGCANPILITSWTDTKIVIEGFPAYQHGQDAFTVGDELKVELRSPEENWAPLKWYSLRVT